MPGVERKRAPSDSSSFRLTYTLSDTGAAIVPFFRARLPRYELITAVAFGRNSASR